MIYTESEVQGLQDRVIELERQLAEAQATLAALTSLEQDQPQRKGHLKDEQALHIQVEEALRESEERFAKAFHASPSALVISGSKRSMILS